MKRFKLFWLNLLAWLYDKIYKDIERDIEG